MSTVTCWNCGASALADQPICTCWQHGTLTPLRFGPWLVKRRLGEGSHGVVYECVNDLSGAEAAIKKLDRNSTRVAADLQELQVPRRLTHPNIVRIEELRQSEGVIVMELVKGTTLRERLQTDAQWVQDNFFKLIHPIADALKAAHAENIIHRDIKPENILISDDGVPKIADFGVCKFLDGTSDFTDGYAGSPAYMSHEVLAGEKYGLEADIHSLGCVIYEIWTGGTPWVSGGRWMAFAGIKANNDPDPLLTASVAPVSDMLSEVVARMIAKPGPLRISRMDLVSQQLRISDPRRNSNHPSLDELATRVSGIYGYKNNDKHALYLLCQLSVSMKTLAQELMSSSQHAPSPKLERTLPKTFAWLCAVASSVNVSLSGLIWLKYDGRCPYCDGAICECDQTWLVSDADRNSALLGKLRNRHLGSAPESKSFDDYRAMFDRIFGARNALDGPAQIALHTYSELNEAIDAVLHLLPEFDELSVLALHLEISDLAAWFFALLNEYHRAHREYNFLDSFGTTFAAGCYSCQRTPCGCPEPLGVHDWRRAIGGSAL